jgi:hypothetical protein
VPGKHAVQDVAPVPVRVFVTDPAGHVVHEPCPAEPVYVPAGHAVAPKQFAAVPLVEHAVVPPLAVTRYVPAGACEHVPVVSVAWLA